MYQIEKTIPIPSTQKWTCNKLYPFLEMEVEDSFLVPCSSRVEVDRIQSSIMGTVRNSRAKYGDRKFTTRCIKEDNTIIGVRCWRIK